MEDAKPDTKKLEAARKRQLDLANQFKDKVLKKYKDIVKAVVIFGSLVRGDFHGKSDIDMLVIIDDTTARFTPEMKERFDEDLFEMARQTAEHMTVQPAWTLSEFWDMARIGHPLLYTIVRDGWALFDTGFFIPVRKLLELGKIPTTLEAVEKFMETAPQKIKRVESAKLYMIAEDLYYSMLNSSQAVLMYMGLNPSSPKHTPTEVEEHLVKNNLLEQVYLDNLKKVIEFRKDVEHKDIKDVSGPDLDQYIETAKQFVSRMEQMLLQLQKRKKDTIVEKNYEVMIKATVAALKNLGKLPPDPQNLPKAVQSELIDNGRIDPFFAEVFKRVVAMRKMLDEDKVSEVSQREIELMREYVRRFVQDLEPFLEEGKKRPHGKKSTPQA